MTPPHTLRPRRRRIFVNGTVTERGMTSAPGRAAGAAIGWRGPAGAHAGCRGGGDKGRRAGSARHRGSAAPPASAPHRPAPPVSTAPCPLQQQQQQQHLPQRRPPGAPLRPVPAPGCGALRGAATRCSSRRCGSRGVWVWVCVCAGGRTWPSGSLSRGSTCATTRVESPELRKAKLLGESQGCSSEPKKPVL